MPSGTSSRLDMAPRASCTTLVERLAEAGVATAAFSEGGFVSAYYGLDRGFDVWEELAGAVRLHRPDRPRAACEGRRRIEHTFGRAAAWLRSRPPGPFLLLVHTYEVHAPFRRTTFTEGRPSGALGETFELLDVQRVRQGQLVLGETERDYLERLYDGGVRAADAQVGVLL